MRCGQSIGRGHRIVGCGRAFPAAVGVVHGWATAPFLLTSRLKPAAVALAHEWWHEWWLEPRSCCFLSIISPAYAHTLIDQRHRCIHLKASAHGGCELVGGG